MAAMVERDTKMRNRQGFLCCATTQHRKVIQLKRDPLNFLNREKSPEGGHTPLWIDSGKLSTLFEMTVPSSQGLPCNPF